MGEGAVLVGAPDDAGVAETGEDAGFLGEAFGGGRIGVGIEAEDFECDEAIEAGFADLVVHGAPIPPWPRSSRIS